MEEIPEDWCSLADATDALRSKSHDLSVDCTVIENFSLIASQVDLEDLEDSTETIERELQSTALVAREENPREEGTTVDRFLQQNFNTVALSFQDRSGVINQTETLAASRNARVGHTGHLITAGTINSRIQLLMVFDHDNDRICLFPIPTPQAAKDTNDLKVISAETYRDFLLWSIDLEARQKLDPYDIMDPRSNGYLTTFDRDYSDDDFQLKAGQRLTDLKTWHMGFDTRIFSSSHRSSDGKFAHLCPYKVRGNNDEYKSHNQKAAQWSRRRVVYSRVIEQIDPEIPGTATAPELHRIAHAFYNGKEVPENLDVLPRAISYEIAAIGRDEAKQIVVNYEGEDSIRFFGKNLMIEKELMVFLQDCALANEFEKSCADRTHLMGGVRVYRSNKYQSINKNVGVEESIAQGSETKTEESPDNYTIAAIEGTTSSKHSSKSAKIKHMRSGSSQEFDDQKRNANSKAEVQDVQGALEVKGTLINAKKLGKHKEHQSLPSKEGAGTKLDNSSTPEAKGSASTKPKKPKQQSDLVDELAEGEATKNTKNTKKSKNRKKGKPIEETGETKVAGEEKVLASTFSDKLSTRHHGSRSKVPIATISISTSRASGDESLSPFEPHDFLLGPNKDENDDAGWEIVKSKARKPPQNSNERFTKPLPTGTIAMSGTNSVSKSGHHTKATSKVESYRPNGNVLNPKEFPAMPSNNKTSLPQTLVKNLKAATPPNTSKNNTNNTPAIKSSNGKAEQSGLTTKTSPSITLKVPISSSLSAEVNLQSHASKHFDQEHEELHNAKPGIDLVNAKSNTNGSSVDTCDRADKAAVDLRNSELCKNDPGSADQDSVGGSVGVIASNTSPTPDERSNTNRDEAISKGVDTSEDELSGQLDDNPDSAFVDQQDTPVSTQSIPVFRKDEPFTQVLSPVPSPPQSDTGISRNIRGQLRSESPSIVAEESDRTQIEVDLRPTTEVIDTPIFAPTPVHVGPYFNLAPATRAPPDAGPRDLAISQQTQFSEEHPEVFETNRGIVSIIPYPSIINHSDYASHYHPGQGPSSLFYVTCNDVIHGQPDNSQPTPTRYVENSSTHSGQYRYANHEENTNGVSLASSSVADAYCHSTQRPSGTTHMTFKCSLCGDHGAATLATPLVLCSGCGPAGNIRYCSVACLLADAYHHAPQCSNLPPSLKLVYHELTPHFIYEKYPIMPLDSNPDTPEKFRQKAFSIYCRSGPFPTILRAWARRNSTRISLDGIDILETQKRTGDYHVFRSSATAAGVRYNPGADVIFTVLLRRGDPLKDIFRRALNASFLVYHPIILDFLFRTIRHFIIDANEFEMFPHIAPSTVVFEEFRLQFSREFGFDIRRYDHDWKVFSTEEEWPRVVPFLIELENKHPILQYWMRH